MEANKTEETGTTTVDVDNKVRVDVDLNAKLVDITDEFIAACQELDESEFSKVTDFKLSDAMSAIELMDPKMDTGMVKIEEKLKFNNSTLESLSNLSLPDQLAIFDASLAMLTSWLNAQPADQTVLTNFCLLYSDSLQAHAPYLHAMAVSIVHAVNLFKLYIQTASVANDEDICFAFNRELPKYEAAQVERLLTTTIVTIQKALKDKRQAANHLALEALKIRLELFSALFELLGCLLPSARVLIGENGPACGERIAPDFKKSGAAVFKCIQLVKKTASTIQLGTQPPAETGDADFGWLSAVFDPNAYLYLSPPGFPRKPTLFTRAEAYGYFERLLDTISLIIREAPESSGSTDEIIDLLRRFGGENSSILTRSMLQLIILPNEQSNAIFGTIPLGDIILSSMNRCSGLLDGFGIEEILRVLLSADTPTRPYVDDFMNLLARGFIGVFQTFGGNLARQREKLLRVNFDDFGVLMLEANRMEEELDMVRYKIAEGNKAEAAIIPSVQNIFSNFLLFTILDLMHHHFALGFQLRLFLPYEYSYVYWYFGEIVCRSLTNLCERVCHSLTFEFSKTTANEQKKVSGKKLQQKNKRQNEFRRILGRMKLRAVFYRVESVMSLAMFKLVTGMIAARQLAVPIREQMRYEKRVEQFTNVPKMLFFTHEEFLRESRISEHTEMPAADSFNDARHLFTQSIAVINDADLAEHIETENPMARAILAIQKCARHNMVAAKLLASQQMTKKVTFEFATNSDVPLCFPQIGFSSTANTSSS